MKKLLLFLKTGILFLILLGVSYQINAQDTTPPVFAMPQNLSFDCLLNGQTKLVNYEVGAGDEFDDTILQAANTGGLSGAAFANGGGVTFDITPINSIVITSFDLYLYTDGVATSFNVDVFYKRGSRVGFENNASAWTLAGTATIPFNGSTSLKNVNFGALGLLAGEMYAIWIRGYAADPAMVAVTAAGGIGDVNFTTSNHHAVRGAFQGTNISGGPYYFRGNINYVLAPFNNVTQIAGLPSGSNFPIGVTTNTFTAKDIAGNISTKSFTVTVNEDIQKPTLTAKPNYTRNADTGNCTFTNTNIPNGIAADNCSVASYSYVLTGATTGTVTTLVNQAFNVGITTVTWTATDANGNISNSDDFTVTVSDNQIPTLTAKSDVSRNTDTGACTFTNTNIPNGVATDNCSIASYSYVLTGATTGTVTTLANQVFNLGVTTVTWTATDANGNVSASDDFTVTVNDTQLPTLTAQSDFTRNADTGVCSFTNTDIPNGVATDNCSIASYSYVLTGATTGTVTTLINQVFNVGITTVTWTATDANGNVSANDVFTVTVNDTQLPTLTAKADVTRNADTGVCTFTNTDIPNGVAADNCSVDSYSYVLTGATTGTVTTLINQVFNVGTTTVTWTATDANGNVSASDVFTVTVNDTQLPTLTAQSDFIRNADIGFCTFTNTDIPNGVAADNCSVASYSYVLTGATTGTVATLTNQVFNVGTTTVTWTATDVNGNVSASDDFTVTVNDNQLPTLTAQSDFIRNADTGFCTFTNTDIPNGVATDNCSVASYSYVLTGATTGTVTTLINQVFNVGTTTVTWTATDVNGNVSASDNFTVTIVDIQNPVITCPTNITVNNDPNTCGAIVTFDLPTVSDNCGIASLVQTAGIASGNLYPVGTITNTFLVTDINGNTASCSFDVRVNQRYELLYSTTIFSEIYPTTSGVLGNTISIRSYACAIFTGTNGEDFVATGKVTISNIPAGLTASIIKISDTELAFKLNGSAINNTRADEIENLTVIFNDAAFVGVTATDVIHSTKTDLAIRFLELIPLNLRANAISTSQITLTWETHPIHRAYKLYRNNRFIREFPTTITRFEDQNLTADTRYEYKLVGIVNQNIESDASFDNEWTFPKPPILLSVSSVCGQGKANMQIEGSGTLFRVYDQEINGNLLLESNNGSFVLPSISENTIFYVSVIGRGGKESERTPVSISVEPAFEAKIIGGDLQTSCENSLELTAQEVENATYTWYLNGNNLNINTQTIRANYSGDYQVRIQQGVCSFISEKVTVQLNQYPIAKIQERNGIKFCQNGIINAVSTEENLSYEWYLNDELVGNTQSLPVTQSGVYTLLITNQYNCQASLSIEVLVTAIPAIPVLEASDAIICPNSETTLSIQNPQTDATYYWLRNGKILRENTNQHSIPTSIKGNYQVKAISNQNAACEILSEEIQIHQFDVLPIYLRNSEDKKTLILEDGQGLQTQIENIEWYFNGGLKIDLGSDFEITPTEEGYYSAKVINQNGCFIQTRTVYFSIPKIPVITGEEKITSDLFKIYPNPTDGIFSIYFGKAILEDIELTIFDGIGRNIYTTTLEKGNQEFKINLQNKPSGIYILHFNQNGSTYSKQIIIE